MIMNFYGVAGRQRYHLGQSTVGWEFMFQGDRMRRVNGIRDWLYQLDKFDWIEDEYGRRTDLDDFLEYVEARLEHTRSISDSRSIPQLYFGLSASRSLRQHCPGAKDELRDEGCFFAFYDFT